MCFKLIINTFLNFFHQVLRLKFSNIQAVNSKQIVLSMIISESIDSKREDVIRKDLL